MFKSLFCINFSQNLHIKARTIVKWNEKQVHRYWCVSATISCECFITICGIDWMASISCSQLQEDLLELHPWSVCLWRVSLVWGSKSPRSGHTGKWCQGFHWCPRILPRGEKYLHIAQTTRSTMVLEEVAQPSMLLFQCCKSPWPSRSLAHCGIPQPQQCHICQQNNKCFDCLFLASIIETCLYRCVLWPYTELFWMAISSIT